MLYAYKQWDKSIEVADNPVAGLLKRARALIEWEEDWCPCGWGDDTGPKCGQHALVAAYRSAAHRRVQIADIPPGVYWQAHQYLNKSVGGSFGDYNDTHTHAEVLARFDDAIALAARHYEGTE